jgi:stress response protein YsnF
MLMTPNCFALIDAMFAFQRGFLDGIIKSPRHAIKTTSRNPSVSAGDEAVILLAEENVEVTKRPVEVRRTRVRRYVEATPVVQTIELASSWVVVERRRPSPVVSADLGALSSQSIEMADVIEVPVVSKRVQVVEEVVMRRTTFIHHHIVRDQARRDVVEIDIEQPIGNVIPIWSRSRG